MTEGEKSDLKKLLFYMESDPKMGHVGIAEKLEQFEKRLDSIEEGQLKVQERNKVLYRVGVGLTGIGTFVVGKSWNNIILFFKSVP